MDSTWDLRISEKFTKYVPGSDFKQGDHWSKHVSVRIPCLIRNLKNVMNSRMLEISVILFIIVKQDSSGFANYSKIEIAFCESDEKQTGLEPVSRKSRNFSGAFRVT